MSNFDKDFDKAFTGAIGAFGCIWFVALAGSIGLICFVIWVILRIMEFYGVI